MTTIEMIKAMGANVSRSHRSGSWHVYLDPTTQGKSLYAYGDDLDDAVARLHAMWIECGSPPWRLLTPEEKALIDAEIAEARRHKALGKKIEGTRVFAEVEAGVE